MGYSATMEIPHYWTADRFSVSWTCWQPTIGTRPAPVNAMTYARNTAVSTIRTRNEIEETLDPSPRPRAVITPGRGLIQTRL